MSNLVADIKRLLRDVTLFARHGAGITLRDYQIDVARAIIESVTHCHGDTICIMFPRQSGKNELQAHVESYLMTLYSQTGGEIVKGSPTWKPQALTAMRRIERVLSKNLITRPLWGKEQGYIFRVGDARIFFLSAAPGANTVSHTASLMLEIDEAQDVRPDKYDRDFFPMTASTHATKVLWGTAWTSRTLLAREFRAAQADEKRDGRRRAFRVTGDDVAREVPAYAATIADQVRKLGRQHPLVKTQFFCEEIDAEGGLFPPARRALMRGNHRGQVQPEPNAMYALLLDVAGEDETAGGDPAALTNPRRDATALTVVQIVPPADPLAAGPTYRAVHRRQWVGVKHTTLYGEIVALASHWHARHLVVDATGVGAGLASFLTTALPGKVIPFVFSSKSKSDLGYRFLAICDTGRWQEYAPRDAMGVLLDEQLEYCTYEAQENKIMKWSVPDGTRNTAGDLIHDDLLLSAALAAELEILIWSEARSAVTPAYDPLADLKEAY